MLVMLEQKHRSEDGITVCCCKAEYTDTVKLMKYRSGHSHSSAKG